MGQFFHIYWRWEHIQSSWHNHMRCYHHLLSHPPLPPLLPNPKNLPKSQTPLLPQQQKPPTLSVHPPQIPLPPLLIPVQNLYVSSAILLDMYGEEMARRCSRESALSWVFDVEPGMCGDVSCGVFCDDGLVGYV
jgi:hypothetical protein